MLNIQALKEKRRTIYLIVSFVIFALVVSGFFIFQEKIIEKLKPPAEKEKTLEETLQELTAPEGELPQVPKEVIENLTAPGKEKYPEISEETIKNLSAPENK